MTGEAWPPIIRGETEPVWAGWVPPERGGFSRWLRSLQRLGWRGLVRWGEPHRGSGRHIGGNVHTDACNHPACPCYQEGRAER